MKSTVTILTAAVSPIWYHNTINTMQFSKNIKSSQQKLSFVGYGSDWANCYLITQLVNIFVDCAACGYVNEIDIVVRLMCSYVKHSNQNSSNILKVNHDNDTSHSISCSKMKRLWYSITFYSVHKTRCSFRKYVHNSHSARGTGCCEWKLWLMYCTNHCIISNIPSH